MPTKDCRSSKSCATISPPAYGWRSSPNKSALQRSDKTDVWVDISTADLICLTSTRPNRVAQAYKKALTDASDHARDAVRRQLLLYQRLGILKENIQAGLESIAPVAVPIQEAPPRVILFTGHRIDAPDRKSPRFPAAKEEQARAMIVEAVTNIKAKNEGKLLGISGGASGGDILFHEVCEELNIPSQMYLVLPRNDYIKASVADSGPDWVERFNRLYDKLKAKVLVRFRSFAALAARQERLQYLAALQSLDAPQCAFYFAGSFDSDCVVERRHRRRSRRHRRHD